MFVVAVRVHRMKGVNDASRTEEQQCLEKRMRGEVKKSRHITAHANSKHHITELADCGIRQHPLNVKSDDGNRRRHQRGNAADIGNRKRRGLCQNREHPRREVNASGYHRGGVDERAYRSRAFHCIGEPSVQRHLCGFPDSTTKDEDTGDGEPYHVTRV